MTKQDKKATIGGLLEEDNIYTEEERDELLSRMQILVESLNSKARDMRVFRKTSKENVKMREHIYHSSKIDIYCHIIETRLRENCKILVFSSYFMALEVLSVDLDDQVSMAYLCLCWSCRSRTTQALANRD